MATVTLKIDGREIEVDASLNLIEAARQLGIHIPHFCYHPGLGVDGNCRMCLVEVEGSPKPVIACNTFGKDLQGKDGPRAVQTASPKVKEWQRGVLEFLFLNHPLDCPICDQSGECFLQDYYMSHGQYESRLDIPKVHKRKVVEVGPRVMLDAERCVLCTRCVRFCDQITGTGELRIVNRGHRAEITTFPDRDLDNDYSLNTVDICPVGALTSRPFRFKKRVWLMNSVHSLCAGCARGCNIYLEHAEGTVYRYRPRENMAVNRYWMCDPGRMTLHALNEDRLETAMRGSEDLAHSVALAEAASWIRAAGDADTAGAAAAGTRDRNASRRQRAVLLLSPASSTETLYACKRFAADLLDGAICAGMGTRPPGIEDEILRKADCYPNTAGLRMLGLERDPEPVLSAGGDLLIIVDDDPFAPGQRPAWKAHAARFSRVLYLGTNRNATSEAAHLALPITPHSECDGTFVNFEGRVQRFRKGVTPAGDALWAPELLRRLAGAAGLSFGWVNLNQLWRDLSAGEPAFAGIDVTQLGEHGLPAGAAPEGAAPADAAPAGAARADAARTPAQEINRAAWLPAAGNPPPAGGSREGPTEPERPKTESGEGP